MACTDERFPAYVSLSMLTTVESVSPINNRQTADPMNPAPPVTRMRMTGEDTRARSQDSGGVDQTPVSIPCSMVGDCFAFNHCLQSANSLGCKEHETGKAKKSVGLARSGSKEPEWRLKRPSPGS